MAGEGSNFFLGPHVLEHYVKRGWTMELILETIEEPYRRVATLDIRALRSGEGQRLREPATAFISLDENYVVVNDATHEVIAVSNRGDAEWKSPFR